MEREDHQILFLSFEYRSDNFQHGESIQILTTNSTTCVPRKRQVCAVLRQPKCLQRVAKIKRQKQGSCGEGGKGKGKRKKKKKEEKEKKRKKKKKTWFVTEAWRMGQCESPPPPFFCRRAVLAPATQHADHAQATSIRGGWLASRDCSSFLDRKKNGKKKSDALTRFGSSWKSPLVGAIVDLTSHV